MSAKAGTRTSRKETEWGLRGESPGVEMMMVVVVVVLVELLRMFLEGKERTSSEDSVRSRR